ncbi:MHS family MFS transporter [Mycobacterium sp. KBS0706]|uniref:MFS transporter n=1 Tax=Mycobacterium sp. KBS0706 TaxID=2578109 RepID=UPI00110F999A|nr:MFS transporter [Mycobacterium sp. KBS0706]TSD83100.1 MHS family MFS transporter [Mycobacterium sp. KBS0706]
MTHAIAADLPSTRRLTAGDYRTLGLAALGGALEFYDFVIFVFFATVVGQLFFPPDMPDWLRQFQTFGVFAAGYLVRPLGGVVMAHFGDLFGRKRMFTLSILLMAAATLGMGLLPTHAQIGFWAPVALLLLRILQGAAIGGEVPGAWVFVAEHVPANRIGYACGTLTAGLTAGILLGSLVATAINGSLSQAEVADWGWRLPFLLGGAFGLLSVHLRRMLRETPIFQEMRARKALAAELPLKAVLRDHRGAVLVSMLLTWLLSGAIVVVILMTPTLLEKLHHVPPTQALLANNLATVGLTAGVILAGLIVDRIGAGRFFAIGCPLLAIAVWLLYTRGAADPDLLLPTYALAGLFVGVVGGVPFVMVRAFPAAIRFSGLSFSYNVSYAVFGGLTPVVVPLLLATDPLAHLHYMLALCVLGCLVGLWLIRREG